MFSSSTKLTLLLFVDVERFGAVELNKSRNAFLRPSLKNCSGLMIRNAPGRFSPPRLANSVLSTMVVLFGIAASKSLNEKRVRFGSEKVPKFKLNVSDD